MTSDPVLRWYAVANSLPRTISTAQEMFQRYVAGDEEAIDANLKDAVYGTVLKYGGAKELDTVWKIYLNATVEDEVICALGSLGCIEHPTLLDAVLSRLLAGEIRRQDVGLPAILFKTTH